MLKTRVVRYSASELRENIYRILDEVLESGIPIEIEWRGQILRIVSGEPGSKLDNLKARPCIIGDPEELVHLDWSSDSTRGVES